MYIDVHLYTPITQCVVHTVCPLICESSFFLFELVAECKNNHSLQCMDDKKDVYTRYFFIGS